jgi:hypothetical protein
MTQPMALSDTSTHRLLRLSGVLVAAMWLVAIIVTDAIQQGTTRNIISNPATAQHTILNHQAVIVVESMTSFYLAALLVVFGAAMRHALGDAVHATAVFGAAVLAAVTIILGAAVSFAELTAAHHHNTTALVTLGYLVAFAWTWEGATWGFLLLATGWAILATKAAPRWFAIASLVLGVPVVLGPGAVLFWALAPIWFALAGFLLSRRLNVPQDRPAVPAVALTAAGH